MAVPDELELKGSEELAMDYEVFGRYVRKGTENGKAKFQGPRTEGAYPHIAFTTSGDGKPTWWVYDASDGECFYAESESSVPPRTGWRKEYGDEDLDVTLEPVGSSAADGERQSKKKKEKRKRKRSDSSCERSRSRSPPRKSSCPW
eukprot:gnl/MRDRNA2_/MRDRNA2_17588_c0_seq1.p1 gnl/MRDRNA2_/MRDRNA2_17588_c0~~gnl/MRDRNA2_/MRDRNA2_17588_c0_seq1.p1  ORF type:complete len:146 (-),score=28.23 gnl/MRDRNA2_/MRDRNA2_17588_c0_seq1:73-510(-)